MRQHKVFLRHELLKYNSEKSTAKSSALENYISSANLSLSGCSSAEPNSVSVGRCKFQLKKLYLQTVKKVDHLPEGLLFLWRWVAFGSGFCGVLLVVEHNSRSCCTTLIFRK